MKKTADEDESGSTRRRGAALISAIHEAAILETAELGVPRLTMEGIARRAGAAKTSLYRRWSSPEDILLEAMKQNFPQEKWQPGTDDLRGDLINALLLMRTLMHEGPMAQALFSIVAESRLHPEFYGRFWEDVFEAHGGRFTLTVLTHYAAAGKIDQARVTPVVADIGEAMMIKFVIDNREPPPIEYVGQIVDQVILPALGSTV